MDDKVIEQATSHLISMMSVYVTADDALKYSQAALNLTNIGHIKEIK